MGKDHDTRKAALGPRLATWPQFHIARAELLRRLGRRAEARDGTGRR